VDRDGTIWVAESRVPPLIQLGMEGRAKVVLTACDGEPFLFPNDICFGPEGNLYVAVYGQGDVRVLSPSKDVVGLIKTWWGQ
jgi:gluconolactonase